MSGFRVQPGQEKSFNAKLAKMEEKDAKATEKRISRRRLRRKLRRPKESAEFAEEES